MEDYYKILGLDRSASEEEIKATITEKLMEYHPDVAGNDDPNNMENVIKIIAAKKHFDQFFKDKNRNPKEKFNQSLAEMLANFENELRAYDRKRRTVNEKMDYDFIRTPNPDFSSVDLELDNKFAAFNSSRRQR